jgi:hypothetical protein
MCGTTITSPPPVEGKKIYPLHESLKGQCHDMDICFKGLNILFSTFCVCADGFKVFQKLITAQYNYLLFISFFEITY